MGQALPWINVASTAISAVGQIQEGKEADKIARFEAAQLQRKATARYAEGTRQAEEQRRQGRIMQSKARAAMGGMGGDPSDPAALRQIGKIGGVGEYNALSALFQAETESDAMKMAAKAKRIEGKGKKRAALIRALPTAISVGTQVYKLGKKK